MVIPAVVIGVLGGGGARECSLSLGYGHCAGDVGC